MRSLKKILLITLAIWVLFYAYLWYDSRKVYPVSYGISFNKKHSTSLGLDWKKNYLSLLDELKPKYLRIAATWSETEPQPGNYFFADVDWQMQEAMKRNVKVTLVIGQKAPRWPECHVPPWANLLDNQGYRQGLMNYVEQVVNRYKNNSALEIWQVENEPFISFQFGDCVKFDKNLTTEEISLVKLLDGLHPVIITDSGELSTWKDSSRAADLFGTTVYRIVHTPQGWYWNYDWLPPSFYRLKAEFWGRDLSSFFVSELQAEPWFDSGNPNSVPIAEQEKSMNIVRLQNHFNFVSKIGVPRAYLWGVEWWYWMKEKEGDERYWELVKKQLTDSR